MHSGTNASLREITLERIPVLQTYDIEMVHSLTIRQFFGQRDFRNRL
jgi:hypothetical protein